MGNKTMKHFRAAANSADRHNRREKYLEHPRPELQPEDRASWIWEVADKISIAQMKAQAAREYAAHPMLIKRKNGTAYLKQMTMPKNAEPVKEAVVLIKPETTIEDVKKWAFDCREKYGIRPVGIYLHLDEGHWGELNPDEGQTEDMYRRTDGKPWKRLNDRGNWEYWKPNYHAHVVFDWMDHDKGRVINLDRNVMRKMEDDLANFLGMERGTPSGRKGLDVNDWKKKKEYERYARELRSIIDDIARASKKLQGLNTMIANLRQERVSLESDATTKKEDLKVLDEQIADKLEKIDTATAELAELASKASDIKAYLQESQQKSWWNRYQGDREQKKLIKKLTDSVGKLTKLQQNNPDLAESVEKLSAFADNWQNILAKAKQQGRDDFARDMMTAARLKTDKLLPAEVLGKNYRYYKDRATGYDLLNNQKEAVEKEKDKAVRSNMPLQKSKQQALNMLYRQRPYAQSAVEAIIARTNDPASSSMTYEQGRAVCSALSLGKTEEERIQIGNDLMTIAGIENFNEQHTPQAWIDSAAEEVLEMAENYGDLAMVFLLPAEGQDIGGGGGSNNDLPKDKDDDETYRRMKFNQIMAGVSGHKKGRSR